MTQVYNLLTQRLRMSLALETRCIDFKRSDISKVRRMARDEARPKEIMEAVGFVGSVSTFRRLSTMVAGSMRSGVSPRYRLAPLSNPRI
jgi:hypothetical protein